MFKLHKTDFKFISGVFAGIAMVVFDAGAYGLAGVFGLFSVFFYSVYDIFERTK